MSLNFSHQYDFPLSNLSVEATATCTWILFLCHLPFVFSGNISFICLVSVWYPLLRLLAVCNSVYLVVCVTLVRYKKLISAYYISFATSLLLLLLLLLFQKQENETATTTTKNNNVNTSKFYSNLDFHILKSYRKMSAIISSDKILELIFGSDAAVHTIKDKINTLYYIFGGIQGQLTLRLNVPRLWTIGKWVF